MRNESPVSPINERSLGCERARSGTRGGGREVSDATREKYFCTRRGEGGQRCNKGCNKGGNLAKGSVIYVRQCLHTPIFAHESTAHLIVYRSTSVLSPSLQTNQPLFSTHDREHCLSGCATNPSTRHTGPISLNASSLCMIRTPFMILTLFSTARRGRSIRKKRCQEWWGGLRFRV